MADLPITEDNALLPVAITDPTTVTNRVTVNSDGSMNHSLGNTAKTNVLKTGSLVTTAVTVDQVVLTYTVTAAKTFFVEYLAISGAQTTPAGGTGIILGNISLETPSGTKTITTRFIGGGVIATDHLVIPFSEPIPVAAGVVIRVVVTPAATTSMTWNTSFGGYEK